MSHSLFYRQDAPQGTNLQVPCPCPLVCSAASRRQPAFGSVLRAGPRGSRHLSDEPEPHCSLRRPCPPAPPLPVPLRALPVKATAWDRCPSPAHTPEQGWSKPERGAHSSSQQGAHTQFPSSHHAPHLELNHGPSAGTDTGPGPCPQCSREARDDTAH